MDQIDFLVARGELDRSEITRSPLDETLEPGQVLMRVDRFALTANNISYALTGDMLGYWGFFPAHDDPELWGRIPAMGFGDVVRSANPDLPEGMRVFGFFPMSTYHVIQARATGDGFVDAASYRSEHAPIYRQYSDTKRDALYTPESEDALLLLRGLFLTSFLADDFLADNDHYGAESLIVSSASSKTSIALAHQASSRGACRVVGLTSPGNADFVRSLGTYDEVCLYDDVQSLAQRPSVFVDMAGNATVVRALHERLGDALRYDCVVGATHWEESGSNEGLPGPERIFFFAPAQAGKRAQEWGAEELQRRIGDAWADFRDTSGKWLQIVRRNGPDALAESYAAMRKGFVAPKEGRIHSLFEG